MSNTETPPPATSSRSILTSTSSGIAGAGRTSLIRRAGPSLVRCRKVVRIGHFALPVLSRETTYFLGCEYPFQSACLDHRSRTLT